MQNSHHVGNPSLLVASRRHGGQRPIGIVPAAFLAAAALACPPALAQGAKEPAVAVVVGLAPGDFLNIRATPSPIGSIQARLPNGAGVTNLGCAQYDGYDWCKVTTLDAPKVTGWTPGRYLHAADAGQEAAETATTPPEPSNPPAGDAAAIPGNLDARIGSKGGESANAGERAADQKLREAIIARYGPVYRAALGLPSGGGADDAAAAADGASEGGAPADPSIPLPTPRPDRPGDATRPAVASVQPAEKAVGEVPCAGAFGQPMSACRAAITRLGPGVADVAVSLPDGGSRTIRFRGGKPDGSDSDEPLHFTREGSLNMIRIGKAERFEILDAVALGK
jgi:uncharacterized protein YraI